MKASERFFSWRWFLAAVFVVTLLVPPTLPAHAVEAPEDHGDEDEMEDALPDEENGDAEVLSEAVTPADATHELPPLPEAFPTVSLVTDSAPRYGAVKLDPWNKNILYFVFDGNRERGYNRMYVWVPDGRQYARPTALSAGHESTFPTITWRTEQDDEVVETAYTFRAVRTTGRTGGRSARTSIDYATGETVTRSAQSSRPYTNISFGYNLTYTRDRTPKGGPNLLRVHIPAPADSRPRRSISLSTNFVGVTPRASWENIDFQWSVQRQYEAEQDKALLRISGRPQHGSGSHRRQVTFEALPAGSFDFNIRVSPYMKDPVFTQTIPMMELARNGLLVEIPFGWYRASYVAETHPWIGGRRLSQGTGLMALGKRQPTATSRLSQDGGPATQLRGPPPPQLRGPSNR